MALHSLQLTHFRNIANARFEWASDTNIICGENGSGKTSILEAIYLLAHGRSFRSTKPAKLIQHEQAKLVVHGKVAWAGQLLGVGMQRDRVGEWQLRLNGEAVPRVADIASLLPVQLITPESFRLFFGGAKERRQFFDLGLFHVEPSFYPLWVQFNKVLKQRNALLKSKQPYGEQYHYWDQQFVQLACQLQQMRQRYVSALAGQLQQQLAAHPLLAQVELALSAGWHWQQQPDELLATLQQQFAADMRLGYTQAGPQKADLRIKIADDFVEDFLSRGQLKVLLFALKLAQSQLIYQSGQKQPLLLIDDMASELDGHAKAFVFTLLQQHQCQMFITAIDAAHILPHLPLAKAALFHVEHGQIVRTE
jgi:DNA replication and repair protein RecF